MSLVIFMPSVISGTGSVRGTFGAKIFWSRRMTILLSTESLLLYSTIVSRPVMRDVTVSSRALIL